MCMIGNHVYSQGVPRFESLLSAIFGGPPKNDGVAVMYPMRLRFVRSGCRGEQMLSVASNDRGVGTFSECELPGIIFTESLPLFLCATLYFSAFCCVLESNALRNVAAENSIPFCES